ncbi:hypothetical protein [Komagataeibacter oboediens]|uniref:Plastocyanin-like domain-containing protein n=1 Tax=Komagataeibacter oboediens TaxID=65958 RepID=A0ABS5SHH4_9PROT|nr:hypothetical protein [Komagataeibacter oboediens]MBT0673796.1 hypothetical protein [Komagataeibacter oboediens]MBT0677481.1 hypothetical protein [Komagataeibacter oboediens]MBV0888488.1 hypothetical protein [Komagataeibacter oboediens]MCK9819214.1 hypothetical protein [Komagataeibacter oboediens]
MMNLLLIQVFKTDRSQPYGMPDPVFRYFVPCGDSRVNPFHWHGHPFVTGH